MGSPTAEKRGKEKNPAKYLHLNQQLQQALPQSHSPAWFFVSYRISIADFFTVAVALLNFAMQIP
jgi:hypothetical protein